MKLIHIAKEFIYSYLSNITNVFYPLWKKFPFVIGEIIYVSHLYVELRSLIKDKLYLFRDKRSLPKQLGIGLLSERIVEIPWALSHLPKRGKHLDAGSSFNFRDTLFNSQLKNMKVFIVNLNPEKNCYADKSISYIFGDLRKRIFINEFFDSISCVSVLEHIGMDNSVYLNDSNYKQKNRGDYALAVKEFKRVLAKKGVCLITVPFGQNEDRNWFQVFNKAMVLNIVKVFDPSSYDISYYQYTESGWQLSTEKKCENLRYSEGHVGKAYCEASKAVACIKLVK